MCRSLDQCFAQLMFTSSSSGGCCCCFFRFSLSCFCLFLLLHKNYQSLFVAHMHTSFLFRSFFSFPLFYSIALFKPFDVHTRNIFFVSENQVIRIHTAQVSRSIAFDMLLFTRRIEPANLPDTEKDEIRK